MLNAEELGVTKANVDEQLKSDNPEIKRLLGVEGNFGEQLGLTKDWAYRIIKLVGNYGESVRAQRRRRARRSRSRAASTRCGPRAASNTRRRSAEPMRRAAWHEPAPIRATQRRAVMAAKRRQVRTAARESSDYDPKVRGIVYQVVAVRRRRWFWSAARSTMLLDNLARATDRVRVSASRTDRRLRHQPDADRLLVQSSTYGRAFWVGLLNTLLVAVLGIVLATILGFVIGIARLSRNWLLANVAPAYVELIRNMPLLLQLLFWYNAVLKALPDTAQSISDLPARLFLNNRGLFLPQPVSAERRLVMGRACAGVAASPSRSSGALARTAPERTGQPAAGAVAGARPGRRPAAHPRLAAAGAPIEFAFPQLGASTSAAASRSCPSSSRCCSASSSTRRPSSPRSCGPASSSVSRGQSEAAAALGLRRGQTLASSSFRRRCGSSSRR